MVNVLFLQILRDVVSMYAYNLLMYDLCAEPVGVIKKLVPGDVSV